LAKLELESLFGRVEPVYNFADKFREESLRRNPFNYFIIV